MSWGRMAADENGGGGIAAVRLLPPFSQTTAAAAGPSGGKFGRCRSIWRLQVYLAASLATAGPFGGKFGRCRSIWRQVLAAAGPLQGRYTRPSFNDAAAVDILSAIFKLCCFSSNSLQVAVSSCVVSNKNKNNAEL